MAADPDGAKAFNEKAMAEFGLGDYAHAAEDYENAFRLKPDGAFLYNAAQAYRLAGNKPRALELYRSFVRLFGDRLQTADARRHITSLEKQIAADAAAPRGTAPPAAAPVATPPAPAPAAPASPAPEAKAPAATPPAPPPASPASPPAAAPPPPALTPSVAAAAGVTDSPPPPATPGPPPEPGKSRLGLWIAVIGGAVAVAAGTTLWIATHPSYPTASFGSADGN